MGLIVGVIFIHKKPDLIQLGLEAIFVGGLARLFAMTDFGALPQFYVPIAIELIFPLILLVLLKLGQRESSNAV